MWYREKCAEEACFEGKVAKQRLRRPQGPASASPLVLVKKFRVKEKNPKPATRNLKLNQGVRVSMGWVT